MRARAVLFSAAAVLFLIDRQTKILVDQNLHAFDTHVVIPGFFNLIHSENTGMAFSLLAEANPEIRKIVLVGFSSIVLAFVAVLLWQTAPSSQRLQKCALTLVFGGACGNLYDRVMRGSVTDFLDFYVGSFHWATFNVADAAITAGAILLALEMLLHSDAKKVAI
jgi:signal peptidase II